MKELSIEEKAKRYDKSFERAKQQLEGAKVFDYDNEQIAHDIRTTVCSIFPELKESEDEKIRKELIDFVKSRLAWFPDCKRFTAWLEKQREQKPFAWSKEDKEVLLESVSVLQSSSYCVLANKLKSLKDRVGCEANCTTKKEWSEEDEAYRSLLIKIMDVEHKNGVFCVSKESTPIFKSETVRVDRIKDWLNSLKPQSTSEWSDADRENVKDICTLIDYAPWSEDFNKEKLKKIEHNVQLTEFEEAVKDLMNDYRDAIGDNDATVEEVKEHAAYMLSLIHQSPAWSEEDERKFSDILALLRGGENCHYNTPVLFDFLKSLKDRVKPQPKQEWSEEDEKRLKSCLNVLQAKGIMGVTDTINTKWLKSLKDRVGHFDKGFNVGFSAAKYNQWKPSEDQIDALFTAVYLKALRNTLEKDSVKQLEELYNQLKKLKE